MSILAKAKGLSKKMNSVIFGKGSIEGYIEGKHFYENPNETIEALFNERAPICGGCDLIEFDDYEPIEDKNEAVSGKMCGDCFCSLPYKLRQTKESCPLKKWK